MNKRKYRLFVICCLVLDLLVMLISGYRYLDRKIPDEIQISRGKKIRRCHRSFVNTVCYI